MGRSISTVAVLGLGKVPEFVAAMPGESGFDEEGKI